MNKEEMLRMRLDGRTYKDIAVEAGITRQRVQQLLSPPSSIRNFVVDKFGGKCNRCGIFVGKSGHVHHNGDEVESYNDIENLELLCIGCHRATHLGRTEKRDRNQRLVEFKKAHPGYTHKAIAAIFHMKRSRVSQILGKNK